MVHGEDQVWKTAMSREI